jgi:hypothetical protein
VNLVRKEGNGGSEGRAEVEGREDVWKEEVKDLRNGRNHTAVSEVKRPL